MNKNSKIGLIVGIIMLLLVLLYFFGVGKQSKYVTDDWTETYSPEDKGPYGTYVMKELLDTFGLFSEFIELDTDIENSLTDVEGQNDIYFFIGKTNYISEEASYKLLDFVAAGNTAFIATQEMSPELNDNFFFNANKIYGAIRDSVEEFGFIHDDLDSKSYTFDYIKNNKHKNYIWNYFLDDNIELWDDNEAYFLGDNSNGEANFIKIEYGEGAFYLHSVPYAFTNVCMLKKDGFKYAETMLKHIPPGQVQWDKYNINYHYTFNTNGSDDNSGDGNESRRSILEFIFKNLALTWAFVILLIAALLFAIFKGKRKQNIVKAVESKENTSLKHVETLSSLYLQEKKHGKLIQLKEKTFLNFIAEHYYMNIHKIDEKFIDQLSDKSGVKKEKIEDIFKLFTNLKKLQKVSDDVLIDLHIKIEYFYKTCK